jgi:hypothetical protein
MTHEPDNPHQPGRPMPGPSSKVMIATAVALVTVLCHVSIEGHGLWVCGPGGPRSPCRGRSTHLRWKDVRSNLLTGITSSWRRTELETSTSGRRTARGKTIPGAFPAGCRSP